MDAPDWVDRVAVDLAIALSAGAFVTWLVLVVPDPAVALPELAGIPPAMWLTTGLSVAGYPLVRWVHNSVG